MKLDVNNISKYFGEGSNKKKAIDKISFSISSGEFKTLVGSSGSGKSTISVSYTHLTLPTILRV